MNVINDFLKTRNSSDNISTVTCSEHTLSKLNNMFAEMKCQVKKLQVLPKIKQDQIWSVKKEYLDYEGILQTSPHPMLVLITTDPESLDSYNEFVRVCPISPFIEMATNTDQICDDSSIVGFPFLVETWNEQPILVDLLDKYAGNYYSDLIEKDEVLNQSQNEFREIEISNARFLNHSIIAYTNEKERSNMFSFSVDLQYSDFSKSKHMPLMNIGKPMLISLRDNEEYAAAARMGQNITENDCIEFRNKDLPFQLEVRKKNDLFVLTIIPKIDVQVIDFNNQELQGMSNSERIVYNDLHVGLYTIKSPLLNKEIIIRLK